MAYRFKKGHESDKIGVNGWKQNITQENLTDDVAELLIKNYPDLGKFLEKGEPLKKSVHVKEKIEGTSKIEDGNKPEAKGPSTPAQDSDLNV